MALTGQGNLNILSHALRCLGGLHIHHRPLPIPPARIPPVPSGITRPPPVLASAFPLILPLPGLREGTPSVLLPSPLFPPSFPPLPLPTCLTLGLHFGGCLPLVPTPTPGRRWRECLRRRLFEIVGRPLLPRHISPVSRRLSVPATPLLPRASPTRFLRTLPPHG